LSITYVSGDATKPQGEGLKIIAHICNDAGAFGAGFVVAVKNRWPVVAAAYHDWFRHRGDAATGGRPPELGAVQYVMVDGGLVIANMIGQVLGYGEGPPIRYKAVGECLANVGDMAILREASVHLPRIGTGLAGGSWGQIEPLITKHLVDRGVEVVVYDLAGEWAGARGDGASGDGGPVG
jgi:O-acetyl-ADP-ribose deacetylase (regulator of RNase III)